MKIRRKTFGPYSIFFVIVCFLISAGVPVNTSAQPSYQIVPGVRVGAITARTSEAELKKIYGRRNVRSAKVDLGEGQFEQGTIIYPNDPVKSIEIVWKDARRKRFPKHIQLTGERSVWKTRDRISLGTTLKELERINGRPFVLAGFSWDYEGTIISWEKGRLEQEFEKNGRVVIIRLSYQTGHRVSGEELGTVQGDSDFPSSGPVMQKINPKVYQIIVEFP